VEWLDWDIESLLKPVSFLISPSQRIFWFYLLTALILAFAVYFDRRKETEKVSLRGFFAYALPASIYKHPAMLIDIAYFLVNQWLLGALVIPLLLSSAVVADQTIVFLHSLFGECGVFVEQTAMMDLLLTFFVMVAVDLGIFIVHSLQHKIPILWEFHKVHHSAEILSPITVYRMHPVDDFLSMSCSGFLIGLVLGIFYYLFDNPLTITTVFRLNLFVFAFYLIGFNLRHSHIWLDYGPRFNWLLLSPAQHQIHHSADPVHFDRNFGFMFSLWDRMLGSLYVPKEKEELNFGLGGEEHGDYRSVWNLYFLPFKKSVKLAAGVAESSALKKAILFVAMALVLGYLVFDTFVQTAAPKPALGKVHIEDLTWTETRSLIDAGYKTIIIPTGGTEQNGPHMILGKHNYVVKYTSGQIALKLGKTLVAPVIAHVPEGQIDPPDNHMKFAGTLTVSDELFQRLLEATARSLKAHGFQTICFIGDSYWNQPGQQAIATKLSIEWAKSGVRVLHISDYYSKNGQMSWLEAKGESRDNIGGHAGIRDTSELMAIYPGGVRPALFDKNGGSTFAKTGVHGDPRRASKQRGFKLLQFKIDAACRQIQSLNPSRKKN
jgi:sterol desaturase/sphingolipid hydroxylase (fatty acid hydroxylase superfamily)/creatinine amidohydrolase/Fe(II)-dependent formamide hydrolase-like protein